ncbi:MAG: T9SS type A sorting domain-containing protein [Bacteroidia bacterium]
MRQLLYIFFFFFSVQMFSQTTFQKTIGGAGGEIGWCIRQTFDKGYIIAGMTYSFGAGLDDYYLVKIDSFGNIQWTKTFGGTSYDDGHFVEQTSDSGYVFVGRSQSFGAGGDDIFLLKTDPLGNIVWAKTFGGPLSDDSYCVHQTTDGGYIISGFTSNFGAGNNDICLIKTDSGGNIIWTKTYGGANDDYGYSVQQTSDGGYIISGETYSFGAGDADVYLIKTNAIGDTLWTKTFGGAMADLSYSGEAVQQTNDHGYIISGQTYSFGAGDFDVYLIKTDSIGNIIWNKTFGGIWDDHAHSVKQTSDGGYIVSGTTSSFGFTYSDAYFLKTNSNGNLLWTKAFGGTNYEESASVCETDDGGFILTGDTYSYGVGSNDIYIIKTDASFNSFCNVNTTATIVSIPATESHRPSTLVSSGCITTNPITIIGSGGILTDLCTTTGIKEIPNENTISVYPNPFSFETSVKTNSYLKNATLTIYNSLGQDIKIVKSISGKEIKISRDNLVNGIYFIELTQDNKIIAEDKLVITD